ncbi:PD-(D/E)XK nuclease family protein [Streptomyces sp. NPDC094448]|uniref:PD-(D/E)XK nuclease family protein n=1 Tax=Streptomyces sp. NPDC094448 TaxID=3366063 RepID=UPI00380CBED2
MSDWPRPLAASDELGLVRAGLPLSREDPADCPAHLAVKARPWLTAARRLPAYDPFLTFTLKPLMTALDLIEFHGSSPAEAIGELRRTRGRFGRGRPAHDGLVEWTVEAVDRFLSRRRIRLDDRGPGEPPTEPVAYEWVVRDVPPAHARPDARGARVYERTAWGRRYASADGTRRELWLLSFGSAKKGRSDAEVAAAASVTAFGRASRPGYDRERHRPGPYTVVDQHRSDPGPQRIRVIDFGCGDGTARTIADCTPAEAARDFARYTEPVLTRMLDGSERRPGRSCVECSGAGRCGALPPSTGHGEPPGLIGLPAPVRPRTRRSLSASDLRAYADCPAKYHLTRELKLRSARPENPAIGRGRAVDAVLNARHGIRRPRGCRGLVAPDDSAWSGLPPETALAAAAMLARHAALCPLDRLAPEEEVRVQAQVTAYDPVLDLVLIAQPDLLHTRRGGWVWRETKTVGGRPYEGSSVLERHPQLALAVLLMRTGELADGDRRRSRIELELLGSAFARRLEIDPWQPSVHASARDIVRRAAGPWLEETEYRAVPGRACRDCEALDWCRAGREHSAADPRQPGGIPVPPPGAASAARGTARPASE